MMFDYRELKAEMARQRVRLVDLADKTGISIATLSGKMKHGRPFGCDQAWRIAQALNLPEVDSYFFKVEL